MDASAVLDRLPAAFQPEAAGGKDYTIQLNISTPAYAVIRGGACTVSLGQAPSSDVALTLSDQDFVELMQGRLNRVAAFMSGQLKVSGDLLLAQRLSNFFDPAALRD